MLHLLHYLADTAGVLSCVIHSFAVLSRTETPFNDEACRTFPSTHACTRSGSGKGARSSSSSRDDETCCAEHLQAARD